MLPDRLSAVARDLGALAAADRRAILAALDPDDRERLRRAMQGQLPQAAPRPMAPNGYSSWFDELVAAARNGDDRMTAAARGALLDALGANGEAGQPRVAGRSLLQAASGLLMAKQR